MKHLFRTACTYGIWMVSLFVFPASYAQETQPLLQLDASDLKERDTEGNQEIRSVSRTSLAEDDIPVTVYIVTREEIISNGYTTLVDVLKSVPEIKVSQPGNAIEGETFLMRGLFGNYYTKILLDGIPLQPSVVSGMPIGEQLPIRQAERVEIILGPSSAVYGSDAMAGVINIVTYESDRPVYVQADITFGSQAYEYLNMMIGGKLGKGKNILSYNIFGAYGRKGDMNVKYDLEDNYNPSRYEDSYDYLDAPYYRGDTTRPEMSHLPRQSRMIGVNLNYRGITFSLLNSHRQTHSSIGQSPNLYIYYDPTNYWGEQINRYRLSYEKEGRNISSQTNLSYLRYRIDNQTSFGLTVDGGVEGRGYKYAASDDIQLEQVLTYRPADFIGITGGFTYQLIGNLPKTNDLSEPFNTSLYKPFSTEKNYYHPTLGTFGYNPVRYSSLSGFLQVYFDLEKVAVLISDRIDYHSLYKLNNNPRIAFTYKIRKEMSLRASFGTAYRAPSGYYSYNSLAFETEDGRIYYDVIPNTDLKAEKLIAAEIGYKWKPSGKFRFGAIAYFHKLDNQFSRNFVLLDPEKYPNAANEPLISQSFVNNDSTMAQLVGFQLNAKLEDLIAAIGFDLEVYFTYSQGKEILPNNFGELDNYRQWPGLMGQVNLTFRPWDRIYLYFRNTLCGKTYRKFLPFPPEVLESIGYPTEVRGYYTLDFMGRVDIGRYLQAFLKVNNIFNKEYAGIDAYGNSFDLFYNPQYLRNYSFGLSFTFN